MVLLYASQVWHPSRSSIRKLMSFHDSCLKWVCGNCGTYTHRLKKLKTLPIPYMLELYDLNCLIAMLTHKSEVNVYDHLSFGNATVGNRSESLILFKQRKPKKVTSQSNYFYRIVLLANHVIRYTNIDLFQNSARKRIKEHFLLLLQTTFNEADASTWSAVTAQTQLP